MFYAHVAGMDVFAHGLLIAAQKDSQLDRMVAERYSSWKENETAKRALEKKGSVTLEELDEIARAQGDSIPAKSGRQELFERVFRDECTRI